MIIRPALPSEAAALAALAMASKAAWGYAPEQVEAWRSELSPSVDSIAGQPTWVAEIAGSLVGFYQLAVDGDAGELLHLWIAPLMMRQGIGRRLLAHAVSTASAAGVANLHIDADPNAELFYTGCGAVRTGVRPAPTGQEPDRVRPQLVIAPAPCE